MLSVFPGTRGLNCLFLKNNVKPCARFKLEELSSCLFHDTNGYYNVILSQVIFPLICEAVENGFINASFFEWFGFLFSSTLRVITFPQPGLFWWELLFSKCKWLLICQKGSNLEVWECCTAGKKLKKRPSHSYCSWQSQTQSKDGFLNLFSSRFYFHDFAWF